MAKDLLPERPRSSPSMSSGQHNISGRSAMPILIADYSQSLLLAPVSSSVLNGHEAKATNDTTPTCA